MKLKSIIRLLSLGAVIGSVTVGCTNDFEEINTNPNNMTEGMATPYNMLEYLVYEPAQWNDRYGQYWHNELVQYTTYTSTSARQFHIYKFSDNEFQGAWNAYGRFALNSRHMYQLAEKFNDQACRAIAMTLEAMHIANQVSLFGDIPYSEAFALRSGGTNTQPKFDTQKEVFEQLIERLDSANEIYRGNAGKLTFRYPNLDGLYGGDVKKWQKFNNSLKLRLLCRVSFRPEMEAGKKMSEMLADSGKWPIFTSNDDNATVFYSGNTPYVNSFYDRNVEYTSLNYYRLTRLMRSLLVVADDSDDDMYTDPRISVMYRMNGSTEYNENGNWLGAISGGTTDVTLVQGRGTAYFNYDLYLQATCPTTFMDFAEVEFTLAEAAMRGLIPGGEAKAKEYYLAGLGASIDRWPEISKMLKSPVELTPEDRDEAMNNDLTSWDGHENKLELIGIQKYIALYMIGFEAFHEIHRTGYPKLPIGNGTIYNDYTFPTRFSYPATTVATNNTNCAEALRRMGASIETNNMRVSLWWSKLGISEGKYTY